jgi:RNA-directed DNA polymerase
MNRQNNIYDKIYDMNNLYLAYYNASKGKKHKSDVMSFGNNLAYNLHIIQKSLINEDVSFGGYHYFKVYDPKERLISAAPFSERVIHHSIMNVTEKSFDDFQIYDSYACRLGKGMHKAVKKSFSICKKHTYFLKLDIRKYFNSIDHNILYNLLERRFKDKSLLNLFWKLISSYEVIPGKGIPIGNLTSQYFANYYLGYLDRFIKDYLRVKDYIRYMDDFLLFGESIGEVHILFDKVRDYLKEKLLLSLKSEVINKVSDGISFLGCRIYRNKILLSKRSKKRFKEKFVKYEKNYEKGFWNIDEFIAHITSLISFTKIANSRNLRNYIKSNYGIISM